MDLPVNVRPADFSGLIFDIGFHNGDDSAYYLSRGSTVVAVDANPLLIDQGRARFSSEIASGRLTLVNAAMWHARGETIPFYVNELYSGKSSIDPDRDQPGGKFYQIDVGTITITELFNRYGIPWYLKIDIEGADEIVLDTLPQGSPMPRYLSCELGEGPSMIDRLSVHGYTSFKLINPETLTQSLPIFNNEFFVRGLRKASVLCPPVRSWIARLPNRIRPQKIFWDPPRTRFSYKFSLYSTGPFGEETAGPWLSEMEMRRGLEYLCKQHERDGITHYWFDVHAKHGAAATI